MFLTIFVLLSSVSFSFFNLFIDHGREDTPNRKSVGTLPLYVYYVLALVATGIYIYNLTPGRQGHARGTYPCVDVTRDRIVERIEN